MVKNTKYIRNLKKKKNHHKQSINKQKKTPQILNIDKKTYQISSAITSNKTQA